jgi:hypothetical protein
MSYITHLFGSFLTWLLKRPSPFIDRKVAGQQILRRDWTEIKLNQPLKPVGDYQQISLCFSESFKMDLLGPLKVRVSNGLLVLPEVELITPNDDRVALKCSGARGAQSLTYRLKDESIKQDYDRIRMRADHEVPLEAIYWTGIVIKNMP